MEKNYKKVKLSSKWTNMGYYGAIGGLVFAVPFALYAIYSLLLDFQLNMLVVMAIAAVLIWLCLYVMKNIAHGRIEDNVIYFKKFNKPEKKYSLDQVEAVKVYENRRDNYVLVTMNDGNATEKYLLPSSKMFYAGEQLNTETVLRQIIENNINK
ncbi:hypothetical protein GO491_08800 [Flavobacteriaceae bacterium Ap0902]|nr:hypothetical protein [Flavobacteriaceae bacterium Ap0902]